MAAPSIPGDAAQVAAAEQLRAAGETRIGLLFVVGEERGSDGAKVGAEGNAKSIRRLARVRDSRAGKRRETNERGGISRQICNLPSFPPLLSSPPLFFQPE